MPMSVTRLEAKAEATYTSTLLAFSSLFPGSNLDARILILIPPSFLGNEPILNSEMQNRLVKRTHQDAQ